ncbi:DUF29 domain-containing protein [Pannus brasiliensis CCIBt3594]|uniref:DUF29 domain-containing protein n=1 Tax=Pannus brasiliensis CCIBt3594 TaxID=1427578 RepID=A0AAW9QLT8_9CHRO
MTTKAVSHFKDLYEKDFVAWADETAEQLRRGEIDGLDWEHIIEEIEGLGTSERRKVDSYLAQLLIHLLLYQYWESEREWCARGWKDEIGNFRLELEFSLESRTLYNYFLQKIDIVYPKSVRRVIEKSELPASTFPETCPFTPEQLLDNQFFPPV